MKPDIFIYKAAIEAASARPEECIFIDDLERNIEGSKKAGIHSFTFQPAHVLKHFGIKQ